MTVLTASQVWKLHLPLGRKLAVVGIFLMGVLAAGSSLVRMIWMIWNNSVGYGDQTDEERKLPFTPNPF
jgi:hypothetical protein